MSYTGVLIFGLACGILSFCHGMQLQDYLTDTEMNKIFNFDGDVKNDFSHQIVNIIHKDHYNKEGVRTRRSVQAFGPSTRYHNVFEVNDNYFLSRDTPCYLMKYNPAARRHELSQAYAFPIPNNLQLLQNRVKRAALTVHTDENGKTQYYGMLGDNLHIRPLPTRVHQLFNNSSNHTDQEWTSGEPHILIKNNQHPNYTAPIIRPKRQGYYGDAQKTRYVEIMLFVSNDIVENYGGNLNDIGIYQASFWNTVDLMYRQFENPRIRLNIAGMIISESKASEAFMYQHLYGEKIDAVPTMREAKPVINSLIRPESYDILVLLTSREMGVFYQTWIDINGAASALGVVCDPDRATVIFRETGIFDIFGAAHEIGHALDSDHDSEGSSHACLQHSGKLMGNPGPGVRLDMWSRCSLQNIKNFLLSPKSQCLLNHPVIRNPIKRDQLLQGRIYNRDAQCRGRWHGDKQYRSLIRVSKNDSNNCKVLECEYDTKNPYGQLYAVKYLVDKYAPLEGTACQSKENGKPFKGICFRDECIPESSLL